WWVHQAGSESVNQQLKAIVIRSPSPSNGLTSCSSQEGNITSCPASSDALAIWGENGNFMLELAGSMYMADMTIGLTKVRTALSVLPGSCLPGSTQYTPLQEEFGLLCSPKKPPRRVTWK